MVEERRHAERRRVAFKVVYERGGSFTVGHVVDLSLSGAFVMAEQLVPVGTEVVLEPVGAAAEVLHELKGRIVRVVEPSANDANQPAGMGLEFLELDAIRSEALGRLIGEIPAAADGMTAPIAEAAEGGRVSARYRTHAKIYADTGSE